MATKLKKMKLTSVDLVRAGANQEADIMLFKSDNPEAQQKLGGFNDALTKAVQSIREDENLDEETRQDLLQETWEQFCAAVAEALGFEIEEDLEQESEPDQEPEDQVKVEKEPELEEIEEVGKGIDTIIEVEKFNPFHDALGRFASSNSFASYSANPKTKDGAAAIIRSSKAGHGATWNVHRESKGENIAQNHAWIQGMKIAPSQRKGPIAGQGSKVGQMAQSTAAKPKQQKPKQTQQPTTQPTATKPKKPTQTNSHQMVNGKDITKTFKPDPNSSDSIPQQIAAKQGYLGKPRVVSSAEYDQVTRASGFTAFRTISSGTDVKTGKPTKAKDFANQLLYGDESKRSLNGSGARAMGSGLYMAASKGNSNGFAVSPQAAGAAYNHSTSCYGHRGRSAVVEATLDPSAKIGDFRTVRSQFSRLSAANRAKFGDVGGYAMAKGYDALRNPNVSSCDYLTVYNMTKVIARDTIGRY